MQSNTASSSGAQPKMMFTVMNGPKIKELRWNWTILPVQF